MGDTSHELLSTLMHGVFYLSLVVQIGIAIAAFLRFKTTASGLLIGAGFGGTVVVSVLFKVVDAVLKAAGPSNDVGLIMFAGRSALQMLLMLVVAVGLVLIPSSLDKLTRRA